MASLRDVQKLRETLLDRMAKKGEPGLLPCALNKCTVDGKPRYHEPSNVEFAEPSVIRERSGVLIENVKDKRLVTICRDCMGWIRGVEIFRE